MTKLALVCDTSPLLYLGRINRLSLLPALFTPVFVPHPVVLELDAGRLLRGDTVDPRTFDWVTLIDVTEVMLAKLPETRLGAGERAVIACALAQNAAVVGLDDRQARLAAEGVGLRVIGAIGVLLRAKRAGLLHSLRPDLEGLIAEGFRVDRSLYDAALLLAGE